jgi:hypothetical protein
MVLNTHTADPSHLKVMILSCPKTGNTWLRWLIHHAYTLPIVDNVPIEWTDEFARTLPDLFVTHQHLWPTEPLVRWLVANDVTVLTTIRHPADALLSYFHYVKWQDDVSGDPGAVDLLKDGDRPGKHTLRYAQHAFTKTYSISIAWARLGACVVRYEDLLENPVRALRDLVRRIAPVDEHKVRAAAFLCKPEQMTRPGLVDARHIRTATARRWVKEIPAEIAQAMAGMEPFKSACKTYSYDWNTTEEDTPQFDYDAIDPFHGQRCFDNGEPIGPSLAKIYLHETVDATTRWPDPTRTEGDSFWNWLLAPCAEASLNPNARPETLTNLMAAVHRMRSDLQVRFPDPVYGDRAGFVEWFFGQAASEFQLPWGLISPVLDDLCVELERIVRKSRPELLGRITSVDVLDSKGRENDTFECGDEITIRLRLQLDQQVDRAVIGYSLRAADTRIVFGTNTTMLGTELPRLSAGTHGCTIRSKLTIPPQTCYVSFGFARYVGTSDVEAIHRIFDYKRITVTGPRSAGGSWCDTRIALDGAD